MKKTYWAWAVVDVSGFYDLTASDVQPTRSAARQQQKSCIRMFPRGQWRIKRAKVVVE